MNKLINGPFAVLMTPFVKDKIDEEAFVAQIKMANDSGISGFVTNGSTAEYIQLSLEEQMRVSEITAKQKAKDKKLIVSACTGNIADTIKLCRHAKSIGADAVLVCPPYYFKYPINEREAYYKQVADLSPVPVILYSVPFFTQEIELDLVFRLFEHENIIGIKDSSANMKRLEHMVEYTYGQDISIMTGTDDILLPALVGGCAGSLTAFAAIYPNEVSQLYKAVKEGDLAKAKEIQFSFMPKLRKADSETFPRGYKRLMAEVSGYEFNDKEVTK
ncbi:MAG: dihydrodipicolinate synthase family protein [Clostridia bacterium]|nr:dihydrodipicolinate synthase family protein [Clostridia bacterium]